MVSVTSISPEEGIGVAQFRQKRAVSGLLVSHLGHFTQILPLDSSAINYQFMRKKARIGRCKRIKETQEMRRRV
jgi:hypothetical protein